MLKSGALITPIKAVKTYRLILLLACFHRGHTFHRHPFTRLPFRCYSFFRHDKSSLLSWCYSRLIFILQVSKSQGLITKSPVAAIFILQWIIRHFIFIIFKYRFGACHSIFTPCFSAALHASDTSQKALSLNVTLYPFTWPAYSRHCAITLSGLSPVATTAPI